MSSAIQSIDTKKKKILPKRKYHVHVKAVTEIELVFNEDKSQGKLIRIGIFDDAFRLFYMLYVSPNEHCIVKGNTPETQACVFVIGSDGTKHEIIVQNNDMFTVIATPGHLYCIRSENDDPSKVEHFNLTLNQDCSTIVNPLPGRQYNFTVPIVTQEAEYSNSVPSFIHVNCFHV